MGTLMIMGAPTLSVTGVGILYCDESNPTDLVSYYPGLLTCSCSSDSEADMPCLLDGRFCSPCVPNSVFAHKSSKVEHEDDEGLCEGHRQDCAPTTLPLQQ